MAGGAQLRAASDPVLFGNRRVVLAMQDRGDEPGKEEEEEEVEERPPQTEVTSSVRRCLVEWLLDVCEEEEAQPEVFCLAVGCLDR